MVVVPFYADVTILAMLGVSRPVPVAEFAVGLVWYFGICLLVEDIFRD